MLAASCSDRLRQSEPSGLLNDLAPRRRILITGGTGFIGQRLVEALVTGGHHVTVLTRYVAQAHQLAHPVRLITDLGQVDNADRFYAVINLAGEGIATGLRTKRKRARIIQPGVAMTLAPIAMIARLDQKPSVMINGSTIGWYGLQGETF